MFAGTTVGAPAVPAAGSQHQQQVFKIRDVTVQDEADSETALIVSSEQDEPERADEGQSQNEQDSEAEVVSSSMWLVCHCQAKL